MKKAVLKNYYNLLFYGFFTDNDLHLEILLKNVVINEIIFNW